MKELNEAIKLSLSCLEIYKASSKVGLRYLELIKESTADILQVKTQEVSYV